MKTCAIKGAMDLWDDRNKAFQADILHVHSVWRKSVYSFFVPTNISGLKFKDKS